jgi:UDP-N-acetylmuramyl pentapeptide phosphotransferase/UDP-N-acetylglucosamine-1-phosphate transferase
MIFCFSALFSILFLQLFFHLPIKKLEDIPNHRSMHSEPIKRSAGFVFFLIFGFMLLFSAYKDKENPELILLYAFITFTLSILGLIDDLFNLSSKFKLVIELGFIFILTFYLPEKFTIFSFSMPNFFYIDNILLTFYIVFIINLTNFMDGLDLYLSLTFIITLLNLYFLLNMQMSEFLNIYLILLFSMSAFFYYNFPNAKMFMGDSGSLPLGLMISLMPLYMTTEKINPDLQNILILIPVFCIDGIFTLLKRFFEKKNIFSAHREHLYQRIQVEKKWSKKKTLFIFSSLNIIPIINFITLGSYFSFFIVLVVDLFIVGFIYLYLYRKLPKDQGF